MKMSYRLERWRRGPLYGTLEATYNWIRHELRARPGLPVADRLGAWGQGFFAESRLLYEPSATRSSEFLSDYQHLQANASSAWNWLYKHKLALRAFLTALGVRQPETVACVYRGRVVYRPLSSHPRSIDGTALQEALRRSGEDYVVKPEDSGGGRDVFLLECRDGTLRRRRGRETETFDLPAFLESLANDALPRATLVERRVEQGEFWAELFPHSANSMRIVTLWTDGDPEPFVGYAVQRIGTMDTMPTDNWSGGGISAPVDLATGGLGVGRMHPLKGRRDLQAFTHHPDTGARIDGAMVPGWQPITEEVLRVAQALPFNPISGWDVLVDREGRPVILEANANSDIDLHQVHGGLLRDPRVDRFYRRLGVL